jgi:magnesium chelatase family protein
VFSLLGIEAVPVDVEVDVSQAAMPKTILVGLPAAAVKESTHRVERAIIPHSQACSDESVFAPLC